MTTARLAFDAGEGVGLGHQRRVEAVAFELDRLGVVTSLVSAEETVRADIVVVDSYRVRADHPGHFEAGVLAAIDDLERDLAVDVVVDPNPPGPGSTRLQAPVALLGPRYAPLSRPANGDPKPIGPKVDEVLVTMGAADGDGIGQAVAAAVLDRLPEISTRLVIGPWGDQGIPARAVAVHAPDGLHAELRRADLVVTAGGVTLLEALRLGRPTVAVVTASNQTRAVAGAEAAGTVVQAHPGDAAGAVAMLVTDRSRRERMSAAARAYVDGEGARRVAVTLVELLARGRSP